MNNISKIIYNHNRKIIGRSPSRDKETHELLCNCRVKDECPFDGNCNLENVVYQTNIFPKAILKIRYQLGFSAFIWKLRWYNHKQSFTNPLLKNQTALRIIGF